MYIKIYIYLFTVLSGLIISIELQGQVQLSTYFDTGQSEVSDGFFVKNAGIGTFTLRKTSLTVGYQLNLKSPGSKFFTGSCINISQGINIKKFSFDIQGLFMYNPFSKVVHEINWGLLVNTGLEHFVFKLGTNFRTYRISKKASEDHGIPSGETIQENWNLMYLFRYNLKPNEHPWNVGITLTNIDYFVINQETNPVIYLHGEYKMKLPLTLYMEPWFKSAGAFNLAVNYFSFFIRTGLIWKPDLKK